MNSVNIIGRLTQDPMLEKTEEGLSICTFKLAIDDAFSKEDRADFLDVVVFGNQGDNCNRYLRKGFLAGVSGRLHSSSYVDENDAKQNEVVIYCDRCQFLQWPQKSESSEE